MRIAVVGAGAMGSLLGGLLAERGEDVLLIGRSAHVETIQQEGLYLRRATSRLPLRLMREGLRTLSAARVRTDGSPQAAALRLVTRLPEPATTAPLRGVARTRLGKIPMLGSTWQSVVRGTPTEIDYLNGEIVALGERIGRPTPYNARVVRLVHDVERWGEFYPPEALWPEG